MKKWQIENSEKSEISEISEKLFRVFDFALQPKSKTHIKNSRKKISEISKISEVSEFSILPYITALLFSLILTSYFLIHYKKNIVHQHC